MDTPTVLYLTIYLIILGLFLLLVIVSRNERTLSEETLSPVMQMVNRAAVWIYRKCCMRSGHRRKVFGKTRSAGTAGVRADLLTLDPSQGAAVREAEYYIDKIMVLLVFLFAADILALCALAGQQQEGRITDGRYIDRNDYGGAPVEITARATSGSVDYGTYIVTADARVYSEDETELLAQTLLQELPSMIIGSNRNLQEVREDLLLIREAEGDPFHIAWDSSNYGIIDTDGSVYADAVEDQAGQQVTLTAALLYEGKRFTEDIPVLVLPVSRTQEELLQQQISEAIAASSESTKTQEQLVLPSQVGSLRLTWEEPVQDMSHTLFLLVCVAGILNYWLSDSQLRSKITKRGRELAIDYPQLVSKIVLYVGAGMSVRRTFYKLGEDYLLQRSKGGEKRYVYEEILLVCREMDSGVSEYDAYAHFGRRCRMRQYTKLSSLLTQNLKKGNSALLGVLQEEADNSFEERKNLARKLGEEAGTKLLLPMVMMLGVTLVIIIIPAYLGFSM